MICLDDRHENSPKTIFCSVCGGKLSALARGHGLPYAWWKLDNPSELVETARSVTALARDSRAGKLYSVKEYYPDSQASISLADNAGMRSFITVAKSLRNVAVPSMRVLFPYTADGRWYTVSLPVAGTPLLDGRSNSRYSEAEARAWLRAVLVALDAIHKEIIQTGPLHHGDVTLANILVQEPGHMPEQGAGCHVLLANSTYLEQFLTEVQLPPEYFVELDLRGAGLAALALLDGKHPTGDQSQRLDVIRDVVLGATLDYLFRPADKKPGSAQQLLHFLDEVSRAEVVQSQELYRAAYQISGSSRLRALMSAAPVPPPAVPPPAVPPHASQPPRPIVSPQPIRQPSAQPPQQPPQRPPQQSPPPPPWIPVGSPSRPRPPTPPSFATRVRQLVKAAMLLFITLAAAVVLGVVLLLRSFFAPNALKPPTIVAEPGVIHHGQNALLRWTANGFTRVELNGQAVKPSGWRAVSPAASTSYRLTVQDPQGRTQSVETRLVVVPLPHAPRKPKAGLGKLPQVYYGDPSGQPRRSEPSVTEIAPARNK